jgi:hypothetical protein
VADYIVPKSLSYTLRFYHFSFDSAGKCTLVLARYKDGAADGTVTIDISDRATIVADCQSVVAKIEARLAALQAAGQFPVG